MAATIPADKYAKALATARREGVIVAKVEGGKAIVYSPKSIRAYAVMIRAGGLTCECAAYGYCKHRAAVREYLIGQRAELPNRERGPLLDDSRPVSMWK